MDKETDNKYIDETFLKANLFEKANIGAGSFPWRYYGNDYYIVVTLIADCGDYPSIYVKNNNTSRILEYSHTDRIGGSLKREELRRCLEFMGIDDEFCYDA